MLVGKNVFLDEIIDSGLCLAVMIPLTGSLINLLYSIVLKLGRNKWRIDKLDDNEKKWILVLACIVLGGIGMLSKNFYFGFSAFALTIGRFCWLDFSKTQISEEFKSIIQLPVFILITIGLCFFILLFMCISEKYVFCYSLLLVLGFVFGIILYTCSKRKK